jgi:hypothetical protein
MDEKPAILECARLDGAFLPDTHCSNRKSSVKPKCSGEAVGISCVARVGRWEFRAMHEWEGGKVKK